MEVNPEILNFPIPNAVSLPGRRFVLVELKPRIPNAGRNILKAFRGKGFRRGQDFQKK